MKCDYLTQSLEAGTIISPAEVEDVSRVTEQIDGAAGAHAPVGLSRVERRDGVTCSAEDVGVKGWAAWRGADMEAERAPAVWGGEGDRRANQGRRK